MDGICFKRFCVKIDSKISKYDQYCDLLEKYYLIYFVLTVNVGNI